MGGDLFGIVLAAIFLPGGQGVVFGALALRKTPGEKRSQIRFPRRLAHLAF